MGIPDYHAFSYMGAFWEKWIPNAKLHLNSIRRLTKCVYYLNVFRVKRFFMNTTAGTVRRVIGLPVQLFSMTPPYRQPHSIFGVKAERWKWTKSGPLTWRTVHTVVAGLQEVCGHLHVFLNVVLEIYTHKNQPNKCFPWGIPLYLHINLYKIKLLK